MAASASSSSEFPFPATQTFRSRSQLVLQQHGGTWPTLISSGVSHPARVRAGAGWFVSRRCAAPLGTPCCCPAWGGTAVLTQSRLGRAPPWEGSPSKTPQGFRQGKPPGFQARESSRSNFSGLLLWVLFVLRPKTPPGGSRWLCCVAISLLASDQGGPLNLAHLPAARGVSVHQICSLFPKKWQHARVFSASSACKGILESFSF